MDFEDVPDPTLYAAPFFLAALVLETWLLARQRRAGRDVLGYVDRKDTWASLAMGVGSLLFALALGLMAWRTTLGGLNAWNSQSTTMMMGFPEWVVYVFMVPPLVLCALIGLAQAVQGDVGGAE